MTCTCDTLHQNIRIYGEKTAFSKVIESNSGCNKFGVI